jgi:anti-anti-sigma factor
MLSIEQAPIASAVWLNVTGALRAPDTNRLTNAVQRILRTGSRYVTIDLRQVTDIDAAGLGALVAARNLVEKAGGRVTLANPRGHVLEMLAVTRLLAVFDVDAGRVGRSRLFRDQEVL